MAITSGRSYTAGAFALEIEGQFAGFLTGVEGGGVFGEVVSSPPGADGVVRKQIGGVGYDPIIVTCGVPEGPWGQWIKGFLEGKVPQHDGAVVFLNYSYQQVRRLELRHATIASVTFPKLDGAGKDAAHLTVTIRPEFTRSTPASGPHQSPSSRSKKTWQSSNFVVEIPGVDCTRVSSVAPLMVSQPQVEDAVGSTRAPTAELGPLEVGDLVLAVAESGAAGFTTWCEDFIVNGNNGKSQEKTATITCKSPNLKEELFSLALQGVGIHRLDPMKQVQGAEAISRITASMYCEEVALTLPKPPAPAAGAAAAGGSATGGGAAAPSTPPAEEPGAPRSRLGRPGARRPEPSEVARRLLSTKDTAPVTGDQQQLRGSDLGRTWSERMATLDELSQLAAAARSDWTAIALPDGHTLIEALQESGVLPSEHSGDLELSRDSFVEGLVQGASDTYDEVKAHLDDPENC